MAQSKTDPWYTPVPLDRSDKIAMRRYQRAVRLSEMRYRSEQYPTLHPNWQTHQADTEKRRQFCMQNWEAYLDGDIK